MRGLECGWTHSVVYDYDGKVYTWGCARHGKLGHSNKFGVFTENSREVFPRKVVSFNDMKIIGAAVGLNYTLLLTNSGEIFLIGYMKGVRKEARYELEYIKPVKCEPIGEGVRKTWMIKIRSGKEHAACVDREGFIYTFGIK